MSDTPPPSSSLIPGPPFNDPDADVILRSSDGIDFRVHRVILSQASPFFKNMFPLPQPNSEPELPTISMAESSSVLEEVLRFWYPGAVPVAVRTLDKFREMAEILFLKYDMQFLVPRAKRDLRDYMAEDPVAVFAIACRLSWKDIALDSAKSTLRIPLRTFEAHRPAYLAYISADTFYTLLHYHSTCAKVATSAASSTELIPVSGCPSPSSHCPSIDVQNWSVKTWFGAYVNGLKELLATAPCTRLDSPELFKPAEDQMAQYSCLHCSRNAHRLMMGFGATLKAKIEQEIESVELNLDF
ncbi:hypothetical protein DFH09DRAFT_1363900 [Mycena vulgaris]|nr:hypothetical protein DFH09DRAFT_1363900 [Mycena vulgaris]